MCSQIPPRDEPLAIAVIPPPLSWPFANPVHRGQTPQSTLAHLRGTFRTRRRLLTTLLRHRPCGHSSPPHPASSPLFAVGLVISLIRCSRLPARLLFPSSRP